MRLALGTAQFGMNYGIANQSGQVEFNEISRIIDVARAAGIDSIDTAISYGASEKMLGEVGVADFRIVTKLPSLPTEVTEVTNWVFATIEQSLSRLGVDRLHGVMLHRAQDLDEAQGAKLITAMEELKAQKLVSKIGLSVYGPEVLDRHWGQYQFNLIQAPFNAVDRRLARSGWLSRLSAAGVEVHTRSAFLQGLLLMNEKTRPQRFAAWDHIWGHWRRWLKDQNISALEGCLRAVGDEEEIDRVVVGVDNAQQLKQIITSAARKPIVAPVECESDDVDLIDPARWNTQ